MTTLTFDTLQFVQELEASGIKPQQAQAINNALKNVINAADVATKNDLNNLKLEIKAELSIVKWMTSATAAGVVAILMKTFF
ncbi:hypothetical protein AGMMS49545_09460 [Betaproteobacteria bacterium]|nr:hypothetical protein AGMMS49545_09460 [Betaproteobacteria bacterium]GHU44397.1 hypothetical protein AGMMS50289_12580 [Betaproteobacteria bacterium]